jgi:hypothetical protein
MPMASSILPFRRIAGVNNRREPVDRRGCAQNLRRRAVMDSFVALALSWLSSLLRRPANGQRFDAHDERAIGRFFVMNHPGFDPAINRSRRNCCDYGGLFGGDHNGVARRTLDTKRGQGAARLPDDIDFMYLDCLFCSAPFCHAVSPELFACLTTFVLLRLPTGNIIGEESAGVF